MHLWTRWVTPEQERKRFDTYFYLAVLPDVCLALVAFVGTQKRGWMGGGCSCCCSWSEWHGKRVTSHETILFVCCDLIATHSSLNGNRSSKKHHTTTGKRLRRSGPHQSRRWPSTTPASLCSHLPPGSPSRSGLFVWGRKEGRGIPGSLADHASLVGARLCVLKRGVGGGRRQKRHKPLR